MIIYLLWSLINLVQKTSVYYIIIITIIMNIYICG